MGMGKSSSSDHVNRVVEFAKEKWNINEPFELTFPLRGANGEYKWFLTRAFPISDSTGKVIRWIGTNTDIDEQIKQSEIIKESEERFRSLAQTLSQLVWVTDAEEMQSLCQGDGKNIPVSCPPLKRPGRQ